MPEEITQDEFNAVFGGGSTNPEGENQGETNEPPADSTDNGASDQGDTQEPDNNDTDAGDSKADEPIDSTKTNHAFAQMRIENKKNAELLKNIAGVLGIQDTSNPEALTQALQDKVINAQAKQQNLPPEVLQRLQTLEQNNLMHQQEELKRSAFLGFQKVKEEFGLDNNAVQEFAISLQNDGVDPFSQPVNVVDQYKLRNFDKLIEAAVEKGIKQESERASKAKEFGSTPNDKSGRRQDLGEKQINTMRDLTKFLSDN